MLTLAELTFSLGDYMKQGTLVACFPWIIFFSSISHRILKAWRTRLIPWTAIVFCFLYFVIFVFFPYSQLRRQYITVTKDRNVETLPFLLKAIEHANCFSNDFAETHQYPSKGAWYIAARCSTISAASWSFYQVELNGDSNLEFFWDGVVSVIPRVIWPDKPQYSPGSKISIRLGLAKSFESAGTSTDAGGLSGGTFLDNGIMWMVVICCLNGVAMPFFTDLFAVDWECNPLSITAILILFHRAAHYFESAMDGNASLYLILVAFFIPASIIYRLVINGFK
jgi:hypothetical protein